MFKAKIHQYYPLASVLSMILVIGLSGCASMGRPEGGLYDEDPPVLVYSEPSMGSTNVSKQRIVMRFDENIKLDNANDKLVVSPPQQKTPRINSNAKTLTIELIDTLQQNTTYSIDLGNAVQDNNEGNPLEGLSMLFSTGDHIDSMQIVGHLLNATNLEPITGAFVGIYRIDEATDSQYTDSLFKTKIFERTGKTNELGAFKILGCAPGTYRLYGLIDGNNNYYYDMDNEDIAFLSDPIVIDDNYQPDSTLVLYAFNEGNVTRYLDDCIRPDSIHINIRFAAPMTEAPKLMFRMPDSTFVNGDTALVAQLNPTLDTLSYWIRTRSLIELDTLHLSLSYLYTDTLKNDVWRTEEFDFEKPVLKPQPKSEAEANKKKHKRKHNSEIEEIKDTVPPTIFMYVKMMSGNSIDIGQKPKFEVSAPLSDLDTEHIHLQVQKDTLWEDMPIRLELDSLHPLRYTMYADPHFSPGGSYRVTIDSAAMHNIYGHPVNETKFNFKEKKTEDYAHLLFNVSGFEGSAFVELLNGSDKPIQHATVKKGQAKFVNVPAGKYFVRLVADTNNNGIYDPGNLSEHKQPEQVYYFDAELQLRANWDVSQNWNVSDKPIIEQKPLAVKKNKPKEKTEKKSKNEEYLRRKGKK